MSNSLYTDLAAASSKKASKAKTPQSMAIPGRESEMAQNNAGGYTFTLDHWGVLDRFLMIGSEGGNYYVGEKDLAKQGFTTVKQCVKEDGPRVVARILEYSLAGRAPKNDPAVVALAIAAVFGNKETSALAYEALPKVARTGTWLFLFVSIVNSLGKWNAAAKRGVKGWYLGKTQDRLTVQLLKYQSRNGWSHRDVLRLAHVKAPNEVTNNLFKYVTKGEIEMGAPVTQLLVDFETIKRSQDKELVLKMIDGSDLLTWEMVPTQFLTDKDVLMALLRNMGLTAAIRKLGALTAHGVIARGSEGEKLVLAKLADVEALKKQRVHPITLLQALKQYSMGRGVKGSLTWSPTSNIKDALDAAFYDSFGTLDVRQEGYYLGVDCSGSMFGAMVNGSPNLTAAEVAGVMAMAIVKRQDKYQLWGFNTTMQPIKVDKTMKLDKVLQVMQRVSWGGTDCAQPMLHAASNHYDVDKFVVITDNETWAGRVQPVQALRDYRKKFKKASKLIVIGTSQSAFTIADPKDPGMLDIAGFDSAAPQIIAEM